MNYRTNLFFFKYLIIYILVKNRNYKTYLITRVVNGFSSLISSGLIIVNTTALRLAKPSSEGYNFLWVNILLISIGVISRIPIISLMISFKRRINKQFKYHQQLINNG